MAFEAHEGFEVGTEGDSFFIAFSRPDRAVSAALLAQQALHREGLDAAGVRVRMGVHTGQVLLTHGDYAGLAVHQAARIAGAAHGGQVLLSATTAALVGAELPRGVTLLDLGEHRLKDLDRPHRLMQLCHPDLAQEFPPPRTLEVVRHNLPVQTSSFVGREQDLAAVAKMLAAGRLVSLLGPGGTGKTRLSYQVAAESVSDFPGGIWVTELAPVLEQVAVALAVLASLGLREEPGHEPTETVVAHLRDRQALVILDNCEQVIAGAAELTQILLERCPALRVLVTSREALHLPGEAVYQVPGLSLPPADLPDYLEALADADAVRLFVTRAVDVRSEFALTAGNAEDIAAICSRLDGLPLAIELAASWARSLSPAQINERLSSALDLLSHGARGAQARQATLRGAIDWSYRLLDEAEQVLFQRLAVFVGGWQLEAAEEVCSGDRLDHGDVLDTLDALVDKSLVAVAEDDKGRSRYRLLDTIGAYATECLTEAGEADPVADRHSAWCASLAPSAPETPQGSLAEADWFDRLESDHLNLLAALEHLRRRGDPEELELAAGLGYFWQIRGHWRLARNQLNVTLATAPEAVPARARLLLGLGQVAINLGDYPQAQAHLSEALAIARELCDRVIEGHCVGRLGSLAARLGDYPEATARYQEALALARDTGDRSREGTWVGSLGSVANSLGDYKQARARYQEALAIAHEVGDRSSEGTWVGSLGLVAINLGDYTEARVRAQAALAIARELGDRSREAYWLATMGSVAINQGHVSEARACFQEALALARDLGDRGSEGHWVGDLGTVATSRGDYPEARARYQEALAIARDLGDRRGEGNWLGSLGSVATYLGDYPEARTRLDEALVIARELQAQDLSAEVIDAVAVLLGRVGRYDEAVELLAWADQTRRQSGAVRETPQQEVADDTIVAARNVIGDEAVEAASNLGADRSAAETLDVAATRLAEIMAEPPA